MSAEASLSHLDEFLDVITALPHDAQRLVSQLREEEAITLRLHQEFLAQIGELESTINGATDESSESIQSCRLQLAALVNSADEKCSIAEQLHTLVLAHMRKLEDEVVAFEEEVNVAKTHGILKQEEVMEAESLLAEAKANEESIIAADPTPLEPVIKSNKRPSRQESSFDANNQQTLKIPPSPTGNRRPRRSSRTSSTSSTESASEQKAIDSHKPEEPIYCHCRQVGFGEMVGCDNRDCPIEWFHLDCVGLSAPPSGKWYCQDCQSRRTRSGI